jgi:hypothetical protein
VIGDHKDGCLMRGNYFKGRDGNRIDALPAAGGFNFHSLLAPFAKLSRALLLILKPRLPVPAPTRAPCISRQITTLAPFSATIG